MQTKYAYGRLSLPTPIITVENTGSISGNSDTYYFWIKARNRVGYNAVSTPLSLVVGNGKQLRISSATFATNDYEDWRHFIISVSKTNNYLESRVIYKQELYEDDQITEIAISDVVINSNFIINGNDGSVTLADATELPTTGLLNGFRVTLTSTGLVYEYLHNSTLLPDNVTILSSLSGVWKAVDSNSIIETTSNCTKEIFEVSNAELIHAPMASVFQDAIPLKYYVINNEGSSIPEAELVLNAYISDTSIKTNYLVKVLGYLNLTTYSLDTTGIDYVNVVVQYPNTKIKLSKALPANSALVIEVIPELILDTVISEGTYITLYPKLNRYTTIDTPGDIGEAVADISSLKALSPSEYKDKQLRYVESVKTIYAFDNESSLADNGLTVLIPVGAPTTGRWLATSITILPNTITPEMLTNDTLSLLESGISTDTEVLLNSADYVINLDTIGTDYLILNTPEEDGDITNINITGTLTNNSTKAILVEIRQSTGLIEFDASILFPGGLLPLFSGEGKSDLFVFKLVKDGSGVVKKRGFLVQKDIG